MTNDFVELLNPLPLAVSLDGLFLTDNPVGEPRRSPLPSLSFLGAGSVLAFAADGTRNPGRLNFRLAAEGGLIALTTEDGLIVDAVHYGAQRRGVSQGRNPTGLPVLVSFPVPSPGARNPSRSSLVLNEILAVPRDGLRPTELQDAFVEVFNPGVAPVDLEGFRISDNLDARAGWLFPPGPLLPPSGHLRIPFAMPAAGGALYLLEPSAGGAALADAVVFGPQVAGYSVGRVPSGSDTWTLTLPTPGAANQDAPTAPAEGVRINEWMAAPLAGPDWFELHQTSPLPVALGGCFLSDDPDEPAAFEFPPLSFIAGDPDGFLVLLADEPATTAHGVGFRLAREGDRLLLHAATGDLLDHVQWGQQSAGISEGRWPDGSSVITDFPGAASPGSPNRRPTLLDFDGDGLPNAWEREHGLDPEVAFGEDGAHGDPDGDGWTNLEEYLAGTHPRDPASPLLLTLSRAGSTLELRFMQPSNRRCEIEFTEDLDTGGWRTLRVLDPVPQGGPVIEAFTPPGIAAAYFRLRVWP